MIKLLNLGAKPNIISCKEGDPMLNRDTIKYLAILAMLLNHIANLFLTPGTLLCEIFLDIGYFTAITMCYFLVEGFHFTHSKRKYGQRLLLFAILSQVPFMLAFHTPTGNMLLTLFLCFLILICMERLPFASVRFRIEIAGLVLLSFFCDWAGFAALFTALFAQAGQDRKRIGKVYLLGYVLFAFANTLEYLEQYSLFPALLHGLISGFGILCSGILILFFYNHKRSEHLREFSRWFFYLFYPLHLLVLCVIRYAIK